jgi:hydroxyacylglutathione hydrolase
MPVKSTIIPCRHDNYAVIVEDETSGQTMLVDAPQAEPILLHLQSYQQKLDKIIITHSHHDHIAGLAELKAHDPTLEIIIPEQSKRKIPIHDRTIKDGDIVKLGDIVFQAWHTPGHIQDHLCYISEQSAIGFTGDTLFSMGCGRLLQGTAKEMWQSLQRLMTLPDDMQLYCGHEYTQSNIAFALSLEPENKALQDFTKTVKAKRAENQPTIPFSLKLEKQLNPFLRCADPAFKAMLNMHHASDLEIFAFLRQQKDNF